MYGVVLLDLRICIIYAGKRQLGPFLSLSVRNGPSVSFGTNFPSTRIKNYSESYCKVFYFTSVDLSMWIVEGFGF